MESVLATYRLQLHGGFPLAAARDLVPYLARLGVTHIYTSPILRARTSSLHGYDVVDPTALNPELGDEAELEALVAELRKYRMGLVLDIVPNHMAAVFENRRWEDVLISGRTSPHARWFDIDWRAPDREFHARVMLPVLDSPRRVLLQQGAMHLEWMGDQFRAAYGPQRFPLDPASLGPVLQLACERLSEISAGPTRAVEAMQDLAAHLASLPKSMARGRRARGKRADLPERMAALAALAAESEHVSTALRRAAADFSAPPDGRERITALLEAQAYRLAHWRRAAREINYRRFFDINELVSLHVENPAVFDETHVLILEWVGAGYVDGLRVDHVDGLRDPAGYLERLAGALHARTTETRSVFVEKILGHDEELPRQWPIAGTTGYDFLNAADAVFLAADGVRAIEVLYHRFTGLPEDFLTVAVRSKRRVLGASLSAPVYRLAQRLQRVATHWTGTGRLHARDLVDAIVETIAHLAVYRTYVTAQSPEPSHADRAAIVRALTAVRHEGRVAPSAIALIEQALLHWAPTADGERERIRFVERFQQTSGPAAAKGVEDTACYVWVPFAARNEVGGEPGASLDDAIERFHEMNARRAAHWPGAMVAASTHDTKRSADVRARLAVLSEIPVDWASLVRRWRRRHGPYRTRSGRRYLPDANTEYLFYQTAMGAWPADTGGVPSPDLGTRLEAYMVKAAREAKVRTSWVDPDESFERALRAFVAGVLSDRAFLVDLERLLDRTRRPGFWNSLARAVLQLTAPGVPDTYQGDELWSFCLVDPDNRRPVDFAGRAALLAQVEGRFLDPGARPALLAELMRHPEDGRIKLHVYRRALEARRRHAAVFVGGSYVPLATEGSHARHAVALLRRAGETVAVSIVPRLPLTLTGDARTAPLGAVWGDTCVRLPPPLPGETLMSIFTGERIPVRADSQGGVVRVDQALGRFPVALLVTELRDAGLTDLGTSDSNRWPRASRR